MVGKRPIVDIGVRCQTDMMTKLATLSFCFLLAAGSPETADKAQIHSQELQWVSGYLDAHWEYPSFLPDKRSRLKIMGFQIKEDQWQKVYSDPVNDAYVHRPDETICFRIVGQGFVAPRKPTYMQPWEGSQFVFHKITKLKRLASSQECASRTKRNLR